MSLPRAPQNLPEAVSEGLNSCVDLKFNSRSEMTQAVVRRVLDYLISEVGESKDLTAGEFVARIFEGAIEGVMYE